jgi:hypothetical protein
MKFSDITGQDVTTLTEAPMGFMKTLGTAAKAINPFSLSGRNQAQGQIKTGMSANQIYAQYYKWLGQTGKPADTDTVLAFLQQNGYGEQAVKAAQSKFPAAPQQTTPANTSTTATPTATPPANQKLTPKQQNDLKAKMQGLRQGGDNISAKTGTGFKDYVGGSGERVQGRNPDKSPKIVTINRESREWLNEDGIPLNKDQLSAIFTAVAQSGAVPQAATGNSTAGANTSAPNAVDQNPMQSTDLGNQQSAARRLPARLTAEQIVNYYANLSSPYDRDQVKKGIAEIDKQLGQQTQQARQQPAK